MWSGHVRVMGGVLGQGRGSGSGVRGVQGGGCTPPQPLHVHDSIRPSRLRRDRPKKQRLGTHTFDKLAFLSCITIHNKSAQSFLSCITIHNKSAQSSSTFQQAASKSLGCFLDNTPPRQHWAFLWHKTWKTIQHARDQRKGRMELVQRINQAQHFPRLHFVKTTRHNLITSKAGIWIHTQLILSKREAELRN